MAEILTMPPGVYGDLNDQSTWSDGVLVASEDGLDVVLEAVARRQRGETTVFQFTAPAYEPRPEDIQFAEDQVNKLRLAAGSSLITAEIMAEWP